MATENNIIKLSGITHVDEIHIAPSSYSIQRAGVEVFLTDEEGFEPYISPNNLKASTDDANVKNEESEDDSSSEDEEGFESINDNSADSAYTLHQGEVVETYYYTDLFKLDFEADYKEMTSTGTFERNEVNLKQFYKGVRLRLLTEWEEPDTVLKWDDLQEAKLGFITEQTFHEDNVEVQVNGMEALLDQTLSFEFRSMLRSEILKEILLSAGMNPIIDVEGLDDDILDFVNEQQSNNASASSSQPIGDVSDASISQLAQQVCQGKTTDLAKAQAIHSWIQQHVDYPSPNYSDHRKCPVEVVKSGLSNCCDRARLGHEMANAVGLQNRGVHGPGHVWVQYKINGEWVDSDPGLSRPSLGSVYEGMSMDSEWTFEKC